MLAEMSASELRLQDINLKSMGHLQQQQNRLSSLTQQNKDTNSVSGSLEGPENGVYVRGQSKDLIINLPDYWTKLVDPNSITVNLTPIGDSAQPRVRQIENNTVEIFSKEEGELNYFYTVFAERVDVESLEVEINCSEID